MVAPKCVLSRSLLRVGGGGRVEEGGGGSGEKFFESSHFLVFKSTRRIEVCKSCEETNPSIPV